MLEFAAHIDPIRSRLSCQLRVDESFDGLVVHVPGNSSADFGRTTDAISPFMNPRIHRAGIELPW